MKLILIKHSMPEILAGVRASQWALSAEGRERCQALSEALRPYAPDIIVSSVEAKAIETGRLVAKQTGKPFIISDGLHEHERPGVELMRQEEFEASVRAFFRSPEKLVFGAETARQTGERFSKAVAAVIKKYPGKNLAVVAHGTVISLFAAQTNGVEPFGLWKKLGLPAFAVFSIPALELLNVSENV